jgi:CRP-like cAMP-binding protein
MDEKGNPRATDTPTRKEQRRHRRLNLGVAGQVNGNPCEISDISRSGIRFRKADELPVGTEAEVAFALPEEYGQLFQDAEGQTVGMDTRVKWCRRDESGDWMIGVEVLHIPETGKQRFLTFLYHGLFKSLALFRGVSDEAICSLAGKVTTEVFQPGEVIVEEASPGTSLYIVSLGSVDVVKELTPGEWTHITSMGAGQYFGEMSLLTGEPTSARVVAAEQCEVLVLHRDDFSDLLVEFPELYRQFIATLSERLRHTTAGVLEERHKEIVLRRLLAEQQRDSAEVLIGKTRAMKELRAALEQPIDDAVCVLIELSLCTRAAPARSTRSSSSRANSLRRTNGVNASSAAAPLRGLRICHGVTATLNSPKREPWC